MQPAIFGCQHRHVVGAPASFQSCEAAVRWSRMLMTRDSHLEVPAIGLGCMSTFQIRNSELKPGFRHGPVETN
jgi:hypothetical protein